MDRRVPDGEGKIPRRLPARSRARDDHVARVDEANGRRARGAPRRRVRRDFAMQFSAWARREPEIVERARDVRVPSRSSRRGDHEDALTSRHRARSDADAFQTAEARGRAVRSRRRLGTPRSRSTPRSRLRWRGHVQSRRLIEELERSYRTQERMSDPAVYNDHREAEEVGRRLKKLEAPTGSPRPGARRAPTSTRPQRPRARRDGPRLRGRGRPPRGRAEARRSSRATRPTRRT